ncbi:MAG: hypothetical protein EPN21_00870 [Methylococcaceae bacterium]|nr:MAG: hypothetical protein EPN21_00870 [Methylococcaceae bacterium]
MKRKTLLAILALIPLLISCAAQSPHPMEMASALQSAKTRADHEALAKHYEEAAAEMQTKVDEHKQLLAHYERERYLYAKQWPAMADHCRNLIRFYEGATQENRQMAELHRAVAANVNS